MPAKVYPTATSYPADVAKLAMVKAKRAAAPRVNRNQSRKKIAQILPLLQTLKDTKPGQRGLLLGHLDNPTTENLCEAVCNVLRNNSVPGKQQNKLRRALAPHKLTLRGIADKKKSVKSRKKKLVQLGGFPFTAILSAAIPLLMNLLMPPKK